MPPKTEKRKSLQEEKKAAAALNGPINTDEWKCAVTFVVEGSENDFELTKKFAEEASNGARIQVKCIDFDLDVMRILRQFAAENLDYNLAYLQNFLPTFEKAAAFMKNSEPIPVELLAQVVKAILLMLKKNDMESPALRTCEGDPIEVMMSKPLVPETAVENVVKTKDAKANNDKKKRQKTSDLNVAPGLRVKPMPGGKDTKLVRRGEKPKVLRLIDDAPQNGVYDMYVALTGFRYANLPLEMIKVDVPLLSVICINSSKLPCNDHDLNNFWSDFRQSIGNPGLTRFYQNVVFQLFVPPDLPTEDKELKNLIYAEVCYLMYDLSDLHIQHTRYLRQIQLFNVEEGTERLVPDQKIARELDELPYECLTIPVILQHILDMICGDDDEDHPGVEERKEEYTEALEVTKHLSFSAPSTFFYSSMYDMTNSDSNLSLIPFTSTVKLPQPRLRVLLEKEERMLYDKIMQLEKMYGIEGATDVFSDGSRSTHQPCRTARKRLPCANLDFEIKNHGKGILTKFWMNYPEMDEGYVRDGGIMSMSQFPDFMEDYLLYMLWIDEKERSIAEKPERTSSASEMSKAKFTITDGSRIALQKTYRENYFSPQQLKIVSQEMLVFLPEPPPQCPALEKSSSSGSCSSTKYLIPINDYDDLWKFMDEKTPSCMKGYDFVEELSANEMISRMEKATTVYDSVSHDHFLPSDSIYVVLSNKPCSNGIRRDVYNVMLVTPVGLRDFHSYVLDERDLRRDQQLSADTGGGLVCPNTLYNPTPDFRDFTDQDFWIENSIKYSRQAEGVQVTLGEPDDHLKSRTETASQSPRLADPNMHASLIGFNFEGDAVQFSGIETTYTGPELCSVRVCLQERLYGKQQLGLHIQQGGHTLHLYSFVCPKPHTERPYMFHAEYQNGIIVAFSERLKFPVPFYELNPGDGTSGTRLNECSFAYDMKLSYPNGLTVETVMKHIDAGYIKQRYLTKCKDSSEAVREENSRLFLPNGNIVRMLTENVAQILMPDTSIITFSLDNFHLQGEYESEGLDKHFRTYTETRPDGWRCTVTGDFVTDKTRLQILKFSDLRNETKYFQRMDCTYYAAFGDGTICVEFPDGSKIYTYLTQEEVVDAEDDYHCGGPYVMIHANFVMEHPEFATVVYESERGGWRLKLPEKSEIKADLSGCYNVQIDGQTELEVGVDVIRMSRYGKGRELVTRTEADLTALFAGSNDYCTTIDSTGRKFTVDATGECQVTEGVGEENREAPKRYFVVRRDLTGFEIMHGSKVRKEVYSMDPDTVSFCEEISEEAGTRYFAFINAAPVGEANWRVESTVPNTRKSGKSEMELKPPSTYAMPPSWLHPFPNKKKKIEVPKILNGRVLLEVRPTDFLAPPSGECFFCDVTGFPEIRKSDISDLMRRVAIQDQEALKEVFLAVVAQKVKSRRQMRPSSSELKKYLIMSEYKVQLREYMKRAIRLRRVVGYFDHAIGIVSLVINQIIEAVVSEDTRSETVEQSYESSSEFTAVSSEVEYNVCFPSEPDYSGLSCRSDISSVTAPVMVGGKSTCQFLLPQPRAVQSAPICEADFVFKEQEVRSYNFGDNLSAPASHICTFTETDISILAEKSPGRAEEGKAAYDLDDLMRLGLV